MPTTAALRVCARSVLAAPSVASAVLVSEASSSSEYSDQRLKIGTCRLAGERLSNTAAIAMRRSGGLAGAPYSLLISSTRATVLRMIVMRSPHVHLGLGRYYRFKSAGRRGGGIGLGGSGSSSLELGGRASAWSGPGSGSSSGSGDEGDGGDHLRAGRLHAEQETGKRCRDHAGLAGPAHEQQFGITPARAAIRQRAQEDGDRRATNISTSAIAMLPSQYWRISAKSTWEPSRMKMNRRRMKAVVSTNSSSLCAAPDPILKPKLSRCRARCRTRTPP